MDYLALLILYAIILVFFILTDKIAFFGFANIFIILYTIIFLLKENCDFVFILIPIMLLLIQIIKNIYIFLEV